MIVFTVGASKNLEIKFTVIQVCQNLSDIFISVVKFNRLAIIFCIEFFKPRPLLLSLEQLALNVLLYRRKT